MPCSSADWVWFHVSSSFSRRRMALRDEDAADIAPARVGVSPRLVVHNTHSGCGGTFCALGVRPSLDTHTHTSFSGRYVATIEQRTSWDRKFEGSWIVRALNTSSSEFAELLYSLEWLLCGFSRLRRLRPTFHGA